MQKKNIITYIIPFWNKYHFDNFFANHTPKYSYDNFFENLNKYGFCLPYITSLSASFYSSSEVPNNKRIQASQIYHRISKFGNSNYKDLIVHQSSSVEPQNKQSPFAKSQSVEILHWKNKKYRAVLAKFGELDISYTKVDGKVGGELPKF